MREGFHIEEEPEQNLQTPETAEIEEDLPETLTLDIQFQVTIPSSALDEVLQSCLDSAFSHPVRVESRSACKEEPGRDVVKFLAQAEVPLDADSAAQLRRVMLERLNLDDYIKVQREEGTAILAAPRLLGVQGLPAPENALENLYQRQAATLRRSSSRNRLGASVESLMGGSLVQERF